MQHSLTPEKLEGLTGKLLIVVRSRADLCKVHCVRGRTEPNHEVRMLNLTCRTLQPTCCTGNVGQLAVSL